MGKVNILDERVFNRISAGEVIERPCSVVKELVENAIDAKANEITINVKNGGVELIEVVDNGTGIDYLDLPKIFLPHATSKIMNVEDLDRIMTLGFRGEALASIGAISKVSVISGVNNCDYGGTIRCFGGVVMTPDYCAKRQGTIVAVEDLFFNTPVRAKFLKTPKGEEAEISNIISRLMLSRPDIAFTYSIDDKIIYQTFGDDLESAMINVYGYEVINNTFYIKTQKNGISIKGYVGKHNYLKSNRTYQTLLVNGRYVINSTINSAITNAYSSYLMKRQYPFYVLSIDMPPEFVDVNVHPNKIDVRFQNNQVVYSTVYSVISSVLDGTSQALDIVAIDTPRNEEHLKASRIIIDERNRAKGRDKSQFTDRDLPLADLLKPYSEDFKDKKKKHGNNNLNATFIFDDPIEPKKNETDIFAENKAYIDRLEKEKTRQIGIKMEDPLVYIGQVFDTFLIYQKKDNMYLVDQHAAHERLLYDKMMQYSRSNIISQPLLVPFSLKPNPLEEQTLQTILPCMQGIGIAMEKTLKNTYEITMVPVELVNMNFKKFVDDLTKEEGLDKCGSYSLIVEKIMQKACKHAIKAGDKLSETEIKTLTKKLNENFGLKCPHGRPIAVKVKKTEIYKWFKRIV